MLRRAQHERILVKDSLSDLSERINNHLKRLSKLEQLILQELLAELSKEVPFRGTLRKRYVQNSYKTLGS